MAIYYTDVNGNYYTDIAGNYYASTPSTINNELMKTYIYQNSSFKKINNYIYKNGSYQKVKPYIIKIIDITSIPESALITNDDLIVMTADKKYIVVSTS